MAENGFLSDGGSLTKNRPKKMVILFLHDSQNHRKNWSLCFARYPKSSEKLVILFCTISKITGKIGHSVSHDTQNRRKNWSSCFARFPKSPEKLVTLFRTIPKIVGKIGHLVLHDFQNRRKLVTFCFLHDSRRSPGPSGSF